MSIQDILDSDVHLGKVGAAPDPKQLDTSDYDDTDNDDEVSDEDAERVKELIGIDPRDLDDEPKAMSRRAFDGAVKWDESKHPRADNGEFGSGSGGSAPKPIKAKDFDQSKARIWRAKNVTDAFLKKHATLIKSPEDFHDAITGGLGLDPGYLVKVSRETVKGDNGKDKNTNRLHVRVFGTIGGHDVEVKRLFDPDKKEVENELMELGDGLQGKGTAKKILENFRKLSQEAGIHKMVTHANLHVGGYTWLKYGYLPKDKDNASKLLGQVKKRWEETHTVPEWDKETGDIKRSAPIAPHKDAASDQDKEIMEKFFRNDPVNHPEEFHALADTAIGKKLLLRSSWVGSLDFKDNYQKKKYEDYSNRK